jgi:periplasmic divalent cation tolerance protein
MMETSCKPELIMVLTNLPDLTTAQMLANGLVGQQLAACVNILPEVQSIYRWQGAIESATEVTLLIKTSQYCYPELQQMVARLHPYDTPELIVLPITGGLPAYLNWIAEETKKDLNV